MLNGQLCQPGGYWFWRSGIRFNGRHAIDIGQLQRRVGQVLSVKPVARKDVRRVAEIVEHCQRAAMGRTARALKHSSHPTGNAGRLAEVVNRHGRSQSANPPWFDVDEKNEPLPGFIKACIDPETPQPDPSKKLLRFDFVILIVTALIPLPEQENQV